MNDLIREHASALAIRLGLAHGDPITWDDVGILAEIHKASLDPELAEIDPMLLFTNAPRERD